MKNTFYVADVFTNVGKVLPNLFALLYTENLPYAPFGLTIFYT